MILSLDMIRPPPAVLVSPLLVSRCLPLSCQSSRLLCVLALTGIDGRVGPKEYITLQSAENCSKYAAELSSEVPPSSACVCVFESDGFIPLGETEAEEGGDAVEWQGAFESGPSAWSLPSCLSSVPRFDPIEKPKDLFDVDRYKEGLRAGAGFTYYAAYLPATKEEVAPSLPFPHISLDLSLIPLFLFLPPRLSLVSILLASRFCLSSSH